jgi:hypothetical protein
LLGIGQPPCALDGIEREALCKFVNRRRAGMAQRTDNGKHMGSGFGLDGRGSLLAGVRVA